MEKFQNIFNKCNLFKEIDRPDLTRMLTCLGANIKHFNKKHVIIPEGSPVKHIGIVLSGSVCIEQIDYFGNRTILSIVTPSEVFAEAFACAGTDSIPISVIANEPSDIMFIDCDHILHTCSNNCSFHQQLIYNLMRDLAHNTVMFHQKIGITSKRTTREKLMEYLVIQSKKADNNTFTIPFDRQELADYLEVDRSGLCVEISKLRKEGILESRKNSFTLL